MCRIVMGLAAAGLLWTATASDASAFDFYFGSTTTTPYYGYPYVSSGVQLGVGSGGVGFYSGPVVRYGYAPILRCDPYRYAYRRHLRPHVHVHPGHGHGHGHRGVVVNPRPRRSPYTGGNIYGR